MFTEAPKDRELSQDSFDENGFDSEGYDYTGFDQGGYDRHGFDREGNQIDLFDFEDTVESARLEEELFEAGLLYERNGYNKEGFEGSGGR